MRRWGGVRGGVASMLRICLTGVDGGGTKKSDDKETKTHCGCRFRPAIMRERRVSGLSRSMEDNNNNSNNNNTINR